jgi:hypothetical protein
MCGACGSDRGAGDWARPFLAGLAARAAVAKAVQRLVGPAGPRVQARGGGWLVRSPTGAVTDCAGLGELVAALGRWLGEPADFAAEAPPSGCLVVPPPDARRGVRLRVDPSAPPRGLGEERETVVVPDAERARGLLAELSRPPWSTRCYLAAVSGVGVSGVGVSGAGAGWLADPVPVRASSAAQAADLLLWLEHTRRTGHWDGAAVAVHCPLEDTGGPGGAELYVEVRAGHVVRASAGAHRA